jgi:hypothetical protein
VGSDDDDDRFLCALEEAAHERSATEERRHLADQAATDGRSA